MTCDPAACEMNARLIGLAIRVLKR